jgi:hypothetical protein
VSSSCARASSARLARVSVSEGMVWGDIGLATPEAARLLGVCKFFAAVQDEDAGALSRPTVVIPRAYRFNHNDLWNPGSPGPVVSGAASCVAASGHQAAEQTMNSDTTRGPT